MLGRDVLVTKAGSLVLTAADELGHARIQPELAALDLGPSREHGGGFHGHRPGVRAKLAQDHHRDALGVVEQRREEVLDVEHRRLPGGGQLLRREDRLLGFLGVSIEFHG